MCFSVRVFQNVIQEKEQELFKLAAKSDASADVEQVGCFGNSAACFALARHGNWESCNY